MYLRSVSLVLVFACAACSQDPLAQSTDYGCDPGEVYNIVEAMPLLANQSLIEYYAEYPAEALEAGDEGRVHVSHIVNKAGLVEEGSVTFTQCSGCDTEALRLAQLARYAPGMQRDEIVCVDMSLVFEFVLSDTSVVVLGG